MTDLILLPINECPRQDLEILGFEFGEEIADVFIQVKLPPGWSLEKSISRHKRILDDEGKWRFLISYNAEVHAVEEPFR